MPRLPKRLIPVVLLITVGTLLAYQLRSARNDAEPVIKIGWQTAWADQGQIIQSLEHTNIPWLYDLKLEYSPFQYGPDQNTAALAGKIDVVNAGIVPVMFLLDQDTSWVAIARVVDFPIAVVARGNAGIAHVADLKGKRFAVPIRGGSHPYAFERLRSAGLDTGHGPGLVTVINVTPNQMSTAMSTSGIDAAAVWEPTLTLLLRQGAKVIDSTVYPSFLMMKRKFVDEQRDSAVRLLAALIEANYFVGHHRREANTWFAQVAKYDLTLVDSLKSVEENFHESDFSRVTVEVRPPDVTLAQSVADFMFESGMITRRLDFGSVVRSDIVHDAISRLKEKGSQSARVQVSKR